MEQNQQGLLRANHFRAIRWAIAIGGLLIFAGLLLSSSFRICEVETATAKGETSVSTTCDGPTVTDAGVIAVALLFVLLLTPDMSEVGVFGLSLKRRVQEAEQKASDSKEKADRLESQLQIQSLRVDTLSQSVAAASAQATSNVYLVSSDEIKKIDTELPKKAEAFTRGETGDVALVVESELPADERPDAILVSRIIENWEILATSLDLPPYRPGARSDVPRIKVSADQSSRFRNLFEEELQVVRATRNNVAHAKAITNEDLRSAVDISEQLLRVLRNPAVD